MTTWTPTIFFFLCELALNSQDQISPNSKGEYFTVLDAFSLSEFDAVSPFRWTILD